MKVGEKSYFGTAGFEKLNNDVELAFRNKFAPSTMSTQLKQNLRKFPILY